MEQLDTAKVETTTSEETKNKFSSFFIDPLEQFIYVFGKKHKKNAMHNKGFAILSNKRVYFKGKCLLAKKFLYQFHNEDRAVDLEDVKGMGYTSRGKT